MVLEEIDTFQIFSKSKETDKDFSACVLILHTCGKIIKIDNAHHHALKIGP